MLTPTAFAKDRKVITIHAKRYAHIPPEITLDKCQMELLTLVAGDVPRGLAPGKSVKSTVIPLETGDFFAEPVSVSLVSGTV